MKRWIICTLLLISVSWCQAQQESEHYAIVSLGYEHQSCLALGLQGRYPILDNLSFRVAGNIWYTSTGCYPIMSIGLESGIKNSYYFLDVRSRVYVQGNGHQIDGDHLNGNLYLETGLGHRFELQSWWFVYLETGLSYEPIEYRNVRPYVTLGISIAYLKFQ